jgi:hypothetical protein
MTFEECVKILPNELASIGYKSMKHPSYNPFYVDNIINFHLDNSCQDCLIRIVNIKSKNEKCICFAEHIHSTDWHKYFYYEFSDEVYKKLMTAARNMVAQYKKYTVDLKIDELSKDFYND